MECNLQYISKDKHNKNFISHGLYNSSGNLSWGNNWDNWKWGKNCVLKCPLQYCDREITGYLLNYGWYLMERCV